MTSDSPTSANPQPHLPTPGRPVFPEGYGLPETVDGLLDWESIRGKLRVAQHYWLASVGPNGRPHSVPRWGVWLDDTFFYDGAPTTRHTRNAEANSAVTLTLESGTDVVIVDGDSYATHADPDGLGNRLAEAFEKYADSGYSPGADSWSGPDGGGLRMIVPRKALAWTAFPTDCTRFTFRR